MKKEFLFREAKESEIKDIAEIESQYFGDYSRSYNLNFLNKWYKYNPKMFYTLSDQNENVAAFFIAVPIEYRLYKRILAGEISDMFDFAEEDVLQDLDTGFYYVADICVNNEFEGINYLNVASQVIKGMSAFLYEHAEFAVTSPITKEGMRLCEKFGFKKVSEEIYEGKSYPICQLVCDENVKKRFGRILRL